MLLFFAVLFAPLFSVPAFAEENAETHEVQAADQMTVEPNADLSDTIEMEETEMGSFPLEEIGVIPDVESDIQKPEERIEKPESAPDKGIVLNDKLISDPIFAILKNGETIYLSIGEKELLQYFNFFRKEMNMNSAAMAGVLANLQCESEFDPNKIGDYGYAYGLCQWRGPRLDAMLKFCEENDLNPITIEGQLYFLKQEFESSHKYAGNLVCDTPDTLQGALQATRYFCCYYEVPSDPDKVLPDREKIAKELLYPLLLEWENSK